MKELLNDAKLIYSILADEESKEIFRNRLLYNLTGENKFLDEIKLENEHLKFNNL